MAARFNVSDFTALSGFEIRQADHRIAHHLQPMIAASSLGDRFPIRADLRMTQKGTDRLLDLGLTPGARVRVELSPAFGDPRAVRVRGSVIALRREQAVQVWVRGGSRSDGKSQHAGASQS